MVPLLDHWHDNLIVVSNYIIWDGPWGILPMDREGRQRAGMHSQTCRWRICV